MIEEELQIYIDWLSSVAKSRLADELKGASDKWMEAHVSLTRGLRVVVLRLAESVAFRLIERLSLPESLALSFESVALWY